MTSLIVRKCGWPVVAAVFLAGCASNPAPVVNHSFGGGQPAAGPVSSQTAPSGARVFATGEHANGTVSNGEYTVAGGDTLYSIAFANGMDVRKLAALNGISAPYVIHPGQVLKLGPGVTPAPTGAAVVSAPIAAGPVAPTPGTAGQTPPSAPAAAPEAAGPVFGPVTTQQMTANGVAAEPAPAASVVAAPITAPPSTPTGAPIAVAAAPASAGSVISGIPPAPAAPAATAATPAPPPGATRSIAGIAWQWPASGKVVGGFQPGSGGDGAGLNISGNMGDPVRAAAAGTVVYSGTGLPGYGALIIVKHNDTYLSAYGHNSKRLVQEGQHVTAGQEIALMGNSGASRVELHFEIRKDGKPVDPLGYLPAR